jgi:hypothetical protein
MMMMMISPMMLTPVPNASTGSAAARSTPSAPFASRYASRWRARRDAAPRQICPRRRWTKQDSCAQQARPTAGRLAGARRDARGGRGCLCSGAMEHAANRRRVSHIVATVYAR